MVVSFCESAYGSGLKRFEVVAPAKASDLGDASRPELDSSIRRGDGNFSLRHTGSIIADGVALTSGVDAHGFKRCQTGAFQAPA